MFGRTNSRPSGGKCKVYTGSITKASDGYKITITNPFASAEKVKACAIAYKGNKSTTRCCLMKATFKNDDGYKIMTMDRDYIFCEDGVISDNESMNARIDTITDTEITFNSYSKSYPFYTGAEHIWEVVGDE